MPLTTARQQTSREFVDLPETASATFRSAAIISLGASLHVVARVERGIDGLEPAASGHCPGLHATRGSSFPAKAVLPCRARMGGAISRRLLLDAGWMPSMKSAWPAAF